jgi:hypothetical protein
MSTTKDKDKNKDKPERCPHGIMTMSPVKMIFCKLAAGHPGPCRSGRRTWRARGSR